MTDRYFVSDLSTIQAGEAMRLSPEESNHAVRVMRIGQGAMVELFDGQSRFAIGNVLSADRKSVVIEITEVQQNSRMPDVEVDMLLAMPKPDRCKEMVARLTELGVRRIVPVVCDRTQRPPSEGLLEKLRRGVVEACKQCRRNNLLKIESVASFGDAIGHDLAGDADLQIAHPLNDSGPSDSGVLTAKKVRIAVGPEGGFTDHEVQMAIDAGYRGRDLGQRIYRIETAAVVAATLAIYRGENP